MFSNFKNTFVRRPQYTISPPGAITDIINAESPDGFEYKYVGDGVYILNTDSGLNIQSGRIKIPEDAKQFFESNDKIDVEKVKKYAYNSQTSIDIVPDEEGCFIVNGNKIKAQNFIKAPLKKYETSNFQFKMIPPEFPKPFPITISGDGYSLELLIRRKAINSIDEFAFETVEEAPVRLNYLYNAVTGKCTFNISTNNEYRKSVNDIVKANHIFNACVSGNGCIAGVKLDNSKEIKEIPAETVVFWDIVLQLEEYLGVKFNPEEELTWEGIDKLYELYQCFVKKEPFKKYVKFTNVKGKGHSEKLGDDEDIIGKETYFEFEEEEIVDVLGVQLKYFGLVGIYGAIVTDIIIPENNKDGEFVIELDEAEGKKMFEAKMYFLSEEELKIFREKENHIEEFKKAEELAYM